ncbi:MAG: hypothetical protein ACOX1O_03365 [Eggerthellaceae bacterium]|jgi:hypothetical protein
MGMLNKDYIVDQFVRFAEAIRLGLEKTSSGGDDTTMATDLLEAQIGESVNIDGSALLALAPESVASILQVSDTDPMAVEYIVRSLLLESKLLGQSGNTQAATLRSQQAYAVAESYGISLSDALLDPDEIERFFKETMGELTDED